MNSKIRAILRAHASTISDTATIGKEEVSDNLILSLNDALEARELVKIKVLRTSDDDAHALSESLAVSTRSEVITVIGSKIVLYRKSHRKNIVHLLEKLQNKPDEE